MLVAVNNTISKNEGNSSNTNNNGHDAPKNGHSTVSLAIVERKAPTNHDNTKQANQITINQVEQELHHQKIQVQYNYQTYSYYSIS